MLSCAPRQARQALHACTRAVPEPRFGVQVKLRSSDNELFDVDEEVAYQSLTVKNMIEGACFAPLRPCTRTGFETPACRG